MTMAPIEVSDQCYQAIEEWLEDYYNTLPFRRIYEGGKLLGYKGFIKNFRLEVEEVISGVVDVRVVSRETGEVRLEQHFDKWIGLLQTPEKQGYLI